MRHVNHEDSAAGHYRTSGTALMTFGAAAVVMTSVLASIREGMLGFIDTPAALVICAIMMSVGAALLLEARRESDEARP